MKHVLVRERLIWEALHQDATSDFDVLWEILQSREVQGYVTDSDLTALYHRLAQEQGFGPAHQLTSHFRRVLKVYSPERDGVLDVAIAHPHDDTPLEPTEDLPTLSVASFLERYVLYQLYQTDTPEVPQGGWYRRWRASGFDPMLLWPVALVLVLQELPAFQQWLLASEMMPGGEQPAHSLLGQNWAIASYPESDATVSSPESPVLTAETARPNNEDGTVPSLSRGSSSPPYPVAPTADPLLIAPVDPLIQEPQFTWREVVTGDRGGDRTPELPTPEYVELPTQNTQTHSPVAVPEPPPSPAVVVAYRPEPPATPPAAPVEPQRVEGLAPRTTSQDSGGRAPEPGHGRDGSSFGEPSPPVSGTGVQDGGSVLITNSPDAPTESDPPGNESEAVMELPSSETSSGEPSPTQGNESGPSEETVAVDALLGSNSAPPHDSIQQANPGTADVLLNPGHRTDAPSAPPPPENLLNLPPHPSFQPFSPKNWQDVLGVEFRSSRAEYLGLSSQGESSLQEMFSSPRFPISTIASESFVAATP